jgi:hypothetical protein
MNPGRERERERETEERSECESSERTTFQRVVGEKILASRFPGSSSSSF